MGRIENKVAIITGGASGIGRATAERFVAEGAFVTFTDVDGAGARHAAVLGERSLFVEHDVTDDRAWTQVFDITQQQFGVPNVLVNCAGIMSTGNIENTSLTDWRRVLDVNLKGTFFGCRHAVRVMKSMGGSIVNVSSVSGMVACDFLCGYESSKGGVRLLSKAIAVHCAENRYRVRCNSVHPGIIETPMVTDYIASQPDPDAERRRWEDWMAVGGMGAPGDVANLILFLASDESQLVTGAEMVIDGAETAR